MKYGVNLYRESLLPRQDWLSFARVLAAVAIAIGLLIIWRGGIAVSEYRVQSAANSMSEKQQELQQETGRLASVVGQLRPDRQLERSVEQLERDLERQRALLSRLRSGGGVEQYDYAKLLFDLPQIHVDGVWLTRIQQLAGDLSLYGKTTDAALLPRWMNNFSDVESLSGKRFAVVELERDDRQVLNFTIQSRRRPQPVETDADEPDVDSDEGGSQ